MIRRRKVKVLVAISQGVSGQINTTFTLFRRTPLELRNKVWGYTIPDSQQITCEDICYIIRACDDAAKAALLVNKESRIEVLRSVKKIKCSNLADPFGTTLLGGIDWLIASRGEVFRTMKKINFNKLSQPLNTVIRPVYTSLPDLFAVQF
ncbi:hypothetical protein VTL71DRAFT_7505 [Oculimacula yallundae]|uniref:2EXR domain-containing protein n=1 Tax=Oculimacula yallundae TaxID=86028 RepID=A0ABR4BV47_9HELO